MYGFFSRCPSEELKKMLKNLIKPNSLKVLNNFLCKREAGHSKWQNIRHVKGLKDAERGAIFTKLSRQMKVAVQEGGSVDPKLNIKLEQVIEQAKRVNMPAATLQNILKSCQNDKSNSKSYMIEIKGPGSCIILCEAFTANLHHLKQTIASILRKNNAKFLENSTKHLFDEKGYIEAESPIKDKSENELLEIATEHAIESNAEEVSLIEPNILEFTCGKSNLTAVVTALEKLNYNILSASVEYTPLQTQELNEDQLKACEKLYEKLEALPEVVKISDNISDGRGS